MPTWMAPKLPPPAKTKAVLAGPAWSDADKVLLRSPHRRVGERPRGVCGRYSSPTRAALSTLALEVRHLRGMHASSPEMTMENDGSALDERLLDHKVAGLVVAAFEKTARFEHLAQFFQHRRAAAHHDAVAGDIQRRLPDIVEQLLRGDQVGDAAAVAERLAGHGRVIHKLVGQQRSEQFVVPQLRDQLL